MSIELQAYINLPMFVTSVNLSNDSPPHTRSVTFAVPWQTIFVQLLYLHRESLDHRLSDGAAPRVLVQFLSST